MKRKIIEIDEPRCTGCGLCVTSCAEGAIAIVNGKAKVVKDEFCDGLGACIGECPEGALRIVEREAPDFDPAAVEVHLAKQKAPREAAHAPPRFVAPRAEEPLACGCPGSMVRTRGAAPVRPAPRSADAGLPAQVNASELGQWPVQLHLVPVRAPFFADRELVVLSTCAPVASADVHWRFLRGRAVVVACPKLDRTESYVEKLAAIFASNDIPRVLVVRMEVPCCGGLTRMVQEATLRSGRRDLVVEEVVVGTEGAVMLQRDAAPGSAHLSG
jgi:ferredoxin